MLKIAFDSSYEHPVPEGHKFPMGKYGLIPAQLLHEGTIEKENLFEPDLDVIEAVRQTHDADYLSKLLGLTLSPREQRKIGFILDETLVKRELQIVSGTVSCALFALEYGCAINVAGGTHHAYTNRGEGFCLLNDIAVGANYLRDKKLANRIAVIDLDVHQGNGTAEIFKDTPEVFTFSMHGKNNYPLRKELSDVDVPLEDGTTDERYLELLSHHLHTTISNFQPDFIFYQSGVDVLMTDKLGRLGLSIAGCKERDQLVFSFCKSKQIPVAVSMGGGYSENIALIVDAHANTYRLAQDLFFD